MKQSVKEIWIFSKRKNRFIKPNSLQLFMFRLRRLITRYKIVNTSKYCLIPWNDKKKQFTLSDKEYKDAKEIYKNKGTISYEFYPCAGLAWGIRVHVLETKEIIDITDVSNW